MEFSPAPGETVLLYTDGLLRRTGDPMDRAFARLHSAAASVPKAGRHDPAAVADHVLRTMLPDGLDRADSAEDVVILAAHFDWLARLSCNRSFGPVPPSVRPYDGCWSSVVSRRDKSCLRSLIPETPEQETEENEAAEPIKQRKNGLYPGVSDELAANMKSGWADTELHGLEPIAQAEHTAARRAALSARFPGERLVIPAGNLRTRSNDTEYAFRASTEYAYLTGDQTQDGVLVLEPTAEGHEATIYLLPRSDRENGEFWLDGQGELWVGRRTPSPRPSSCWASPRRTSARSPPR